MVDALAKDRSNQPLGNNGLVTDAPGAQLVGDGSAVDAVLITDQVARRLNPRECLCDLACDPFRSWMRCDVDPDKVSRATRMMTRT